MECNKDEAARLKALAERKMMDKDFVGAKEVIAKTQQLSKEVDDIDIPKMLTVCDVHCAAGAKVNAEIDWYGILQVPVTADDALIKKQYRKLAILLHPDKNNFGGAEAAFKLVGEANITLTDKSKRFEYDMKRNPFRGGAETSPYQQPRRQASARSRATPGNLHEHQHQKRRQASARSRATPGNLHEHQRQKHQAPNPVGSQTTFWTICPSCGMRYQYYISILKKALCCQNCLKKFIAHELKEQAVPSGVNQRSAGVWTNAGGLQNFPSPQTNITSQKAWFATPGVHVNSGSHHANVDTKRETGGNTAGLKEKSDWATGNASKVSSTAGLKKRRRAVIESSESSISETSSDSGEEILKHGPAANSAGPGQQTCRSSRQKQGVKYNEESDECLLELDPFGTEKGDVPKGFLELDPAALPSDLEEVFPSVIPECNSVRSQEPDARCAGSSNGNRSHKGSMNFREGQHSTCMNERSAAKTPKEMNSKHNTSTAKVTDVDDDNVLLTEYVYDESEFYDFSEIRSLQKFSPEQIWALYSAVDKFPNYYGFIQKVDLDNAEIQVRWLDVCPQGEEEIRLLQEQRPIGCGTFRLSSSDELMTYSTTDAFSHLVEARYTGKKGEYEIIPNLGEIWAVFKNWKAGWTAQDFERCEYELVKVLSHTDSSIGVQVLRKVDGYGAVFMPCRAEGSLKTIRKDEYPKFSHQIPRFDLKHVKGRGYLELDPLSLTKGVPQCEIASSAVNLEPACGETFGTKVP